MKGMSVAWRNVRDKWRKELHEKPKLLMKLIVECEVESSCVFLGRRRRPYIVFSFRF